MQDGTFLNAFKDKWHYANMLADIPVSVVLNESAPLIGAAYEAFGASK
jgi:glucokinase